MDDVATLELNDDAAGFQGALIVDYDLDYFVRVVSVHLPLEKQSVTIAPYLSDIPCFSKIVIAGTGRRSSWISCHRDMQGESLPITSALRKACAPDLPLLLRSATGGIGNIRIEEAAEAEAERLCGVQRRRVTEAEIRYRSDRFMEVADRFGLLASGSSGLQGEWPKVSMTQANDGLYYPDSFVTDDEAVRHVIVKLVRSNEPVDLVILEGEALCSRIAQEIGLNVSEPSTYAEGVLIIPRFDRKKGEGEETVRLGQESLVSAIGVADFGHVGTHEAYIDVLRQHSADRSSDTVEYLKRDIANLALGNPDNHGWNSALSKHEDGTIRLSPLFDFAPMRLAKEGIVRSTRWAIMRDGGRDHLPDWKCVCKEVMPDPTKQKALAAALCGFAGHLRQAPDIAYQMEASPEILERVMGRCVEIADSVLATCL
ncbi:type II toxin-antitoxin system HipA family toxin [Rhizobium populisoli]|uniref:type II toxin-antitoxin system HipA family toxin n=1 Tax=Rhizobium populisoli TaxID=2859785 RepID=UPI0028A8AEC4|nr:HipA domain-containing protein [Rhizobium populisoli]